MSTQTISLDWLTITMSPRLKYQDDEYDKDGNVIHHQKKYYLDELYNNDWTARADAYLTAISDLLDLKFNKDTHNSLAPLGYTQTFSSGSIFIGYHELYEYMGICLQFSGDGLRQYRTANKDKDCVEAWIMRSLDKLSDIWEYSCGATRIDIAIDEYNGDTDVQDIVDLYHKPRELRGERNLYTAMETKCSDEIRVPHRSGTQVIANDEGGISFYVGSLKSKCRLNIYDKTAEQKASGKTEVHEKWVRYEGRFRSEYARQIYNNIKNYEDYAQYGKYLYRVMDSKWEFRLSEDPNDLHPISKSWKEHSKGVQGILKADDRRVSTMQTSYDHIAERSGLFSYLRKAELLYGEEVIPALITSLLSDYEEYKTTSEVNNFVESNKEYRQTHGEAFETGRLYNDARLPKRVERQMKLQGMAIPEFIGSDDNDNPESLADVTPSADGSGFLNPKGLTEADE